jgi:hypothetical protein
VGTEPYFSEGGTIYDENRLIVAHVVGEDASIARRMAASSQMLDALKYIVGWNPYDWSSERARDLAVGAIEEAEEPNGLHHYSREDLERLLALQAKLVRNGNAIQGARFMVLDKDEQFYTQHPVDHYPTLILELPESTLIPVTLMSEESAHGLKARLENSKPDLGPYEVWDFQAYALHKANEVRFVLEQLGVEVVRRERLEARLYELGYEMEYASGGHRLRQLRDGKSTSPAEPIAEEVRDLARQWSDLSNVGTNPETHRRKPAFDRHFAHHAIFFANALRDVAGELRGGDLSPDGAATKVAEIALRLRRQVFKTAQAAEDPPDDSLPLTARVAVPLMIAIRSRGPGWDADPTREDYSDTNLSQTASDPFQEGWSEPWREAGASSIETADLREAGGLAAIRSDGKALLRFHHLLERCIRQRFINVHDQLRQCGWAGPPLAVLHKHMDGVPLSFDASIERTGPQECVAGVTYRISDTSSGVDAKSVPVTLLELSDEMTLSAADLSAELERAVEVALRARKATLDPTGPLERDSLDLS